MSKKGVSTNRVHHIKEFLPIELAKIVSAYVKLPLKERLERNGNLHLHEKIKERERKRSQFYRDINKSKQPPKPPKQLKPCMTGVKVECECGRIVNYYKMKIHVSRPIHFKRLLLKQA